MSTEAEYIGTVSAIVEKKGGWYSVEILVPGKQYPVKADTKLEPLLEQARQVRDAGLVATFTVSESESENINPKSGKPYMERRLEHVEPGASTPSTSAPKAAASSSEAPSQMTKEEWARKDSAIHKMACIKTAADALKHTIPSDPSKEDLKLYNARVIELALGWHRSVIAERDDPTGNDIPF